MDDEAARDVVGDVADRSAAGSLADGIAVVGMAMNHEIDVATVDDPRQFHIAKQEVLQDRFGPEGGDGRREMGDDNLEFGVEVIDRFLEPGRFPARPHGEALQRPSRQRVRALVRPKTAARTADSGKAELAASIENERAAIDEPDPGLAEEVLKCKGAHAAAVMIPADGNDGEVGARQPIGRELRLSERAVVRDVAGDHKNIGALGQAIDLLIETRGNFAPDMQIANRGNAK